MDGEESVALLGGVVGLDGERHASAFGQQAHGVHEPEAVLLHQELEHIAMLAAAETMVALAGGVDVEGGGLLLVERTAGLEGTAHAPERDPGVNEADNVGSGANLLQDTVCDALGHMDAMSSLLGPRLVRLRGVADGAGIVRTTVNFEMRVELLDRHQQAGGPRREHLAGA